MKSADTSKTIYPVQKRTDTAHATNPYSQFSFGLANDALEQYTSSKLSSDQSLPFANLAAGACSGSDYFNAGT